MRIGSLAADPATEALPLSLRLQALEGMDLRCFHCAEHLASIVVDPRNPRQPRLLASRSGLLPTVRNGRLACPRCGGPVYAEDAR